MNTTIFSLIVLLSVINVATAAIGMTFGMAFPSTHPDYPGKCWDLKTKNLYSVGVNYPKGACKRVICGADYSMLWFTCEGVSVLSGSNYRLAQDLSKRYPECCPK